VALNVPFHLFQELTNQFTAVIVSDKTNHKIQEMIDIHEMIEAHDIHEMIEAHDIHEMIEAHDIHEMIEAHDFPPNENLVEKIIRLENHEMINF